MALSHASVQSNSYPWVRGIRWGFLGACIGGIAWFLFALWIGHFGPVRAIVGIGAVAVGVGAGLGALRGAKARGWKTQAIAIAAALPLLALMQIFVTRLVLVRDVAEVLDIHGAAIWATPGVYWNVLVIGLFGTAPPGIVFWAITLGAALASPRRDPHA